MSGVSVTVQSLEIEHMGGRVQEAEHGGVEHEASVRDESGMEGEYRDRRQGRPPVKEHAQQEVVERQCHACESGHHQMRGQEDIACEHRHGSDDRKESGRMEDEDLGQ